MSNTSFSVPSFRGLNDYPPPHMNLDKIYEMLNSGQTVYMFDDFYEVAIRILPSVDGKTRAYLKHKGRNEVEVPPSYKTVFEIKLGGEFFTKEEYAQY